MICKRCSKTVLTRQEFIRELSGKHNIRIDHATLDPVLSMGTGDGYRSMEAVKQKTLLTYKTIEKDRAFQCSSCRNIYCMDCLFKHAPSHVNGGKACFSCMGAFMEI